MANYCKKISDTKIRIGEIRMCYCNVFSPKRNEDGTEGKYGMCVLIPKTNTQAVALIEQAIEAAKAKGKSSKWGGKIPGRLTLPLRDGDEEDKGEEYEGMYFINVSSPSKPGVRVLEDGHIADALDDDDIYSGCWGCVTLNAFAYDSNGNKGVSLGLDNVLKTSDGDRLAGGASAESDFADLITI